MKLLIHPPVEEARLRRIEAAAGEMTVVNAIDETQAERAIVDADAYFGKITRPMLAAATKLRWVQSATASLEHYVFPELVNHPCVLTNMRGLYSDIIAEHVFGYVICFARNFHRYFRNQLEGRWAPVGDATSTPDFQYGPGVATPLDLAHAHIAGATMGIVGLGHIGQEIARRASAFDMRVVAVDPVRTESTEGVSVLWTPEALPRLLAESDYVVIAAPHTPATERLFRAEQFARMKSTAYLINIGRGAIVVLDDLCCALRDGTIAGAGLDVCEIEPLPPDHPLWAMENVIITPHVAGYAPRVAERHLALLLDNIGRFTRGEPLRNVVDKAMWF